MKQEGTRVLKLINRFIRNYQPSHQSKYIHLTTKQFEAALRTLPYFPRQIAQRNGYFDYRGFTILSEKTHEMS